MHILLKYSSFQGDINSTSFISALDRVKRNGRDRLHVVTEKTVIATLPTRVASEITAKKAEFARMISKAIELNSIHYVLDRIGKHSLKNN